MSTNTKIITVDGLSYHVEHEHDMDADAPWTDAGHGPVRETRSFYMTGCPTKNAGELQLGHYRLYNFADACRMARRENWGCWSPDTGMSRRQFAAEQARKDYQYLRDWVDDKWCYLGITVTLLDADGAKTDVQHSLWRVGGDDPGYVEQVEQELVNSCYMQVRDLLQYDDEGTHYTSKAGARTITWRLAGPEMSDVDSHPEPTLKWEVTCISREVIEVEAATYDEAIEIAQNIDSAEFEVADTNWTAEQV